MDESLSTQRAALFGRYDGEEGGDVSPVVGVRGGPVDPQNPDHWPWNVYAREHGTAAIPVPVAVTDRCPGHKCKRPPSAVRADTLPLLTAFCAGCRERGRHGLRRGFASAATVVGWLCNPRRQGRAPGTPSPHRAPLCPGGNESLSAASRRTGVPISTLLGRADSEGIAVTRDGLPAPTWTGLAAGWVSKANAPRGGR